MSRLSIEMTSEQHQRLKAVAALYGKSIREYVLDKVLPPLADVQPLSEMEALHQLETMLKPRIETARRGEIVLKSVTQIFEETFSEEDKK